MWKNFHAFEMNWRQFNVNGSWFALFNQSRQNSKFCTMHVNLHCECQLINWEACGIFFIKGQALDVHQELPPWLNYCY